MRPPKFSSALDLLRVGDHDHPSDPLICLLLHLPGPFCRPSRPMPTRSSAPAAQQPALSNQSPRIDTFRVLFGVGVAAILALLALSTPLAADREPCLRRGTACAGRIGGGRLGPLRAGPADGRLPADRRARHGRELRARIQRLIGQLTGGPAPGRRRAPARGGFDAGGAPARSLNGLNHVQERYRPRTAVSPGRLDGAGVPFWIDLSAEEAARLLDLLQARLQPAGRHRAARRVPGWHDAAAEASDGTDAPVSAGAADGFQQWICLRRWQRRSRRPARGRHRPGTRWADVPEDWRCPLCDASAEDFAMVPF